MTDQTNKLEPCPFCGGAAAVENGPAHIWYVECRDCGVDGKIGNNESEAIAAWNRRASASAALSTGDLRDRLVAVSSAIADQDDREAQAILREALRLLDSAPAAGSVPSDEQLMKIAERHGFALAQPGRYGIEWLVAKDNTVPSFLALVRALLAQYGSPVHGVSPEVAETLRGIVNADWTQWGELACPEEFVRWAKARAAHVLSLLSVPQEGK